MAIIIKEKANCCGCLACVNICPQKCIEKKIDKEGFWYPSIDQSVCIECGLCELVCPMLHDAIDIKKDYNQISIAAINNNSEIRMKSSSGGIFSLFAEQIINESGVVYGAAFDDKFDVNHIRITDTDEIDLLRRSKYVQSDIGDTYSLVKNDLSNKKCVLFTGTPCQIAGLRSFLRKEYDNLYTQDFICHGVPSPMVWEKYLSEKRLDVRSEISAVNFRDKTNGWDDYNFRMDFKNGRNYYVSHNDDAMMKSFLSDLCLRPSCYFCGFKGGKSSSDITLADFWGVEGFLPEMNDNNGTSIVLINNEKGKFLFERIKSQLVYSRISNDIIRQCNYCYEHSVDIPKKRSAFFREILKGKNFENTVSKYTNTNNKRNIVIIKTKRFIKRIRKSIKRRLGLK